MRVIAANTPVNLASELSRVEAAWRSSGPTAARFVYEPKRDDAAPGFVDALGAIAAMLEREGPLGAIYAARARELALDARLCELAGEDGLREAANARYARRDAFDDEADATARAWLDSGAADAAAPEERALSHDEASRISLVSRMRAEVERRELDLRVIVKENLASLAATGDGVIQVGAGRSLGRRDVERTVLHEIHGHALPRAAAALAPLGIFASGTAFGSDDQEGRALVLEEAAGFLDTGRRREIALRHLTARSVEAGADFVASARLLLEQGADLATALRVGARAHRGGGLARERVYLPAFLRVKAAIAANADVDMVLAAGRVGVGVAPALRAWMA